MYYHALPSDSSSNAVVGISSGIMPLGNFVNRDIVANDPLLDAMKCDIATRPDADLETALPVAERLPTQVRGATPPHPPARPRRRHAPAGTSSCVRAQATEFATTERSPDLSARRACHRVVRGGEALVPI